MYSRYDVQGCAPRISLGHLTFHAMTEDDVIAHVDAAWDAGRGGLIVTPNVDIWLQTQRNTEAAGLVGDASIVVADGAPIVWASRLARVPLPARVTGSSLIESLSAAAGRRRLSAFVLGGGGGDVCYRAAGALTSRHPGLRVAGALAPPFGFDERAESTQTVIDHVTASQADLVFVGLGFPRQEKLATELRRHLPRAWVIGCGAAIAMAAGETRRPPVWAQRLGLEWLVRLAQEPGRLAHRYLVDDLPAAIRLLVSSAVWGMRASSRYQLKVRADSAPASVLRPSSDTEARKR